MIMYDKRNKRLIISKQNATSEFWDEHWQTDNFYQFILDSEKVKVDVEKYGFKLVLKYPFDVTKGLKDEIPLLKPIMEKIYNSQNLLAKVIRFSNSILFSKIAAHNVLLVFRKEK